MEKRDKISAAVFIIVILAMCLVPSLGMLFFGPSEAGANEVLAQAPKISDELGFNPAVLSDARAYVNDRFFLRQELITMGRGLSAAVFGTADTEDVLVGYEGWLFFGETMDCYAGINGLSDRELFSAANNVRLMEEYCLEQGIDVLFTLAPNKNSVYPEYMRTATPAGERDSGRLYALFDAMEVKYLDLFAVFQGQEETLYFAHDSHWNSRGAALAADAINGALGRESDFFGGEFVTASHSGDLFEMLYPAAKDTESDLTPANPPEFTFGQGGTRPDSITINTVSTAGGVLLCYRDSFGNDLFPYLAASFGSARFSRSPQYDMTLASQLDADTVIIELVERNIDYLLDYAPVVPAPKRDMELPPAVGKLRVFADNSATEGWAVVSGELPEAPDDDSPVYICNGEAVYEAVLTRDGFTALLPAANGPWAVAFYVGGQLVSYEAV